MQHFEELERQFCLFSFYLVSQLKFALGSRVNLLQDENTKYVQLFSFLGEIQKENSYSKSHSYLLQNVQN